MYGKFFGFSSATKLCYLKQKNIEENTSIWMPQLTNTKEGLLGLIFKVDKFNKK